MEQKKDKIGGKKILALMGTVPIPPQDSPGGRVVLGPGLKRILQLLLSNSVLASASPLRPAQLGEHLGAAGDKRDLLGKGWVRRGCQARLSAAPVCCSPALQKALPAVFSCMQQDKPSR